MVKDNNQEPVSDDENKRQLMIKEKIPLVIEVIPGQALEGLVDIYQSGTYENQDVMSLVRKTLDKDNWSVEEHGILDDIKKQLDGGKLIYQGQEVKGTFDVYAKLEKTQEGEKYWYIGFKAIKPQEGGSLDQYFY